MLASLAASRRSGNGDAWGAGPERMADGIRRAVAHAVAPAEAMPAMERALQPFGHSRRDRRESFIGGVLLDTLVLSCAS